MPGVRHIVTLTLREGTSADHVEAMVAALRALPESIPEIRSYVVGADLGRSEGNATAAVVGDFDSWDDFVVYRDHPDHKAVGAEWIVPVLESASRIQHELP